MGKKILELIFRKSVWESVTWTDMAEDRYKWRAVVKEVMSLRAA
jgi:hypothetical protein